MDVAINATSIEIAIVDTATGESNIENNFFTPETNATIAITSTTPSAPTSPVTLMNPVYVFSERERVRMEFYQTYDVMTGIRIATTLGSFFTLMVLLVLYKSKCKSKADENLEAAITAAVAEEEEMEAVLNQSKYDYSIPCHRQSLGNMSAPACSARFSSFGGYGGLMNPPRRYDRGARGRISLPASDVSFRYFRSAPTSICNQDTKHPFWRSYNEEEENDLEEIEEIEDNHHEVKLAPIPTIQRQKYGSFDYDAEPPRFTRRESNAKQCPENRPNIKVIQPTPQISPSESNSGLLNDDNFDQPPVTVPLRKLAPLASIGSCSAISSMESDRSMGSDSVFLHNDNEDDTDKDQNEDDLSSNTRSDHDDCTNRKYRLIANRFQTIGHRFSDPSVTTSNQEKPSSFPIVTNLASHATSHITTQLYNPHSEMIFESGSSNSSSTNLLSDRSHSNSTSSEKPATRRPTGVRSTIAIINVNESPVESTSKNETMNKRSKLSKSEPKTMHEPNVADHNTDELRTLSLRNLSSRIWNKETLF